MDGGDDVLRLRPAVTSGVLPLRRRRVIAFTEGSAPAPYSADSPHPQDASLMAFGKHEASAALWHTVADWGLGVSGPEDLKRLRALFDELGQSAFVVGSRAAQQPDDLRVPTAAEMATLAAEVRRLDLAVGAPSRQLRRRARAASPPPPSTPRQEEESAVAACRIQRAARQRSRWHADPVRMGAARTRSIPVAPGRAPSEADPKMALLERCERAACGRLLSDGASAAEEAAQLRELLGHLVGEHRSLLVATAGAADGGVHARSSCTVSMSLSGGVAPRAADERALNAAREEREIMAAEIQQLVQALQKGAAALQQERCEAAASKAAAQAVQAAEAQALVVAQEAQEDVLRAAAGGGAGGGGGGGGGGGSTVVTPGVPDLVLLSASAEQHTAVRAHELSYAEALACPDAAAAIRAASALAALPRTPRPSVRQGPTASIKRAVLGTLELIRRPPPSAAMVPLLSVLGRLGSLNAAAAAAALAEGGALSELHSLVRADGSGGDSSGSHGEGRDGASVAMQAAGCIALGELVDSAGGAALAALLTTADEDMSSLLDELVKSLLRKARLMPSAGSATAATATARGGDAQMAKAGSPTRALEAAAAGALAALVRARGQCASLVPASAVSTLVGRLAQCSSAAAGGGEKAKLLVGELALCNALRAHGVDLGRVLRVSTGWTRLVGMLDAPPPGTATSAAKAALQLDLLLRSDSKALKTSISTSDSIDEATAATVAAFSAANGLCAVSG